MKPGDAVSFCSSSDNEIVFIKMDDDQLISFLGGEASKEEPYGKLLFSMTQATFDAAVENYFGFVRREEYERLRDALNEIVILTKSVNISKIAFDAVHPPKTLFESDPDMFKNVGLMPAWKKRLSNNE